LLYTKCPQVKIKIAPLLQEQSFYLYVTLITED